jgi:small-conductance mechanosensitive channel
MALVIVGSVGDLLSFGFAPMSLLAPIGAMTLVVRF